MKLLAQHDARGRKVLRLKQTREELRAEIARPQARHQRFLRVAQTVNSLDK